MPSLRILRDEYDPPRIIGFRMENIDGQIVKVKLCSPGFACDTFRMPVNIARPKTAETEEE